MIKIKVNDIRRHGNYIMLGQHRTATEGRDGNMPTLTIKENSKEIKSYRGSSLYFGKELTSEDKEYLASLGSDE